MPSKGREEEANAAAHDEGPQANESNPLGSKKHENIKRNESRIGVGQAPEAMESGRAAAVARHQADAIGQTGVAAESQAAAGFKLSSLRWPTLIAICTFGFLNGFVSFHAFADVRQDAET